MLYEFNGKDGIYCVGTGCITAMEYEKRVYRDYEEDEDEPKGDKKPHYILSIYLGINDYLSVEFSTWAEGLDVYNTIKLLRNTL